LTVEGIVFTETAIVLAPEEFNCNETGERLNCILFFPSEIVADEGNVTVKFFAVSCKTIEVVFLLNDNSEIESTEKAEASETKSSDASIDAKTNDNIFELILFVVTLELLWYLNVAVKMLPRRVINLSRYCGLSTRNIRERFK
jgi:hypothetical protein